MSDRDLRDLARRFAESGSLEAEVAWLTARLRAGALKVDWLRLAAYSGHPAARAVLGAEAPDPPARHRAWFPGLAEFGKDAAVCAALALARRWLPLLAEFQRSEPDENRAHDAATEAVATYLACPCEVHRRATKQHSEEVAGVVRNACLAASRVVSSGAGGAEKAAARASKDAGSAFHNFMSNARLGMLVVDGDVVHDLDDIHERAGSTPDLLAYVHGEVARWALRNDEPPKPPATPKRATAKRRPSRRGPGLFAGYHHPHFVIQRASTKAEAAEALFARLSAEVAAPTSAQALQRRVGRVLYCEREERLWLSTQEGTRYVVHPGLLQPADYALVPEEASTRSLANALALSSTRRPRRPRELAVSPAEFRRRRGGP